MPDSPSAEIVSRERIVDIGAAFIAVSSTVVLPAEPTYPSLVSLHDLSRLQAVEDGNKRW